MGRIGQTYSSARRKSLSKRGDQASPAQLGITARLKESLKVRDMAPSLCSLSLVVYVIGSGQVNDLLGGNKTLPPL